MPVIIVCGRPCQIYDVRSGEIIVTRWLDHFYDISGSYLFSNATICCDQLGKVRWYGDELVNGGVKVLRINWTGSWNISTHLIKVPEIKPDMEITLSAITDTRVLWRIEDGFEKRGYILCDYLLE